MGNWVINIEGTGQHHNNQHPKDADVLAIEIVKILRAAGHNVEYATFTSGGRVSAMPPSED